MKTTSLWFTLRIICERSTDKPDYGLTAAEAADAAIVDFDDMDADVAQIDDTSEVEACPAIPADEGLTVFEMDFLLTAENTADGLSEFDSSVFFMIPGFDVIATETRPADTTEASA
jgi:hypothetical protein